MGTTAHRPGIPARVPTRDGRTLFASVQTGPPGPPGPIVVFEAGAAATRSSWALVQPAVAEFATAIAYDRSGLGRSAPDPIGRTLDRMADDLVDVLRHFGAGPYVLVGHSAGGPIARLAAARTDATIAGLVLADTTDEAADVLFGRGFRTAEKVAVTINLSLARLGVLERLHRANTALLPPEARADLTREGFGVGPMRTHAEQARTFLDELAAFRSNPPDIGEIPVTVVSGTRPGDGMPRSVRAAANASHAHRAAASPYGRHVLATKSAHYVPMTDAELIIDEIRRLVEVID
ncbi:MAG: alpha/beta hydrolase [Propionibacteriales bacterium]|nr:alpha/beta hydrolase [Propionibacteriales bacterium]